MTAPRYVMAHAVATHAREHGSTVAWRSHRREFGMHPICALKPRLLLYPFRFFDPIMGRWVRARYLAERHEIEARYRQWEIIGPPEIRTGGYAAMFSPWRRSPNRLAHLPPDEDPPPDHGPTPDPPPVEQPAPIEDPLERFLVLLFLRRYITYCASLRRFAQMNGAARLFADVRAEHRDGRS